MDVMHFSSEQLSNTAITFRSHRFKPIKGDTRHADQRHFLEPHGVLRLPRGQRRLQRLLLRRQVSSSTSFLSVSVATAFIE